MQFYYVYLRLEVDNDMSNNFGIKEMKRVVGTDPVAFFNRNQFTSTAQHATANDGKVQTLNSGQIGYSGQPCADVDYEIGARFSAKQQKKQTE